MVAEIERADAADEREPTQGDWVPPGHADLARRLDRLTDRHPSSTGYNAGDSPRQSSNADLTDRLDKPVADGRERSGWQAPEIRGHRDAPDRDAMHTVPERARHILEGDGPGTSGGGHRHGTGRPGKTEFPAEWSDDRILSTVADVARDPERAELQDNGRWLVAGVRDGVRVWVAVRPDGGIWTSWPEPGGPGVRENPRA